MKATVAVVLLAAWAGAVSAWAAQPASSVYSGSSEPNQDSRLAAESFLNSAVEMTCCPSSTPARAGRLVVLSRFADRLVPGDWRVQRLLADIYLAQADPNAEIKALESYLAGQPNDYQFRVRWMSARLAGMQNVADRDAFLRSVAERKDLDESVRAQALATLTDLMMGQGANRRRRRNRPAGRDAGPLRAGRPGRIGASPRTQRSRRISRPGPAGDSSQAQSLCRRLAGRLATGGTGTP